MSEDEKRVEDPDEGLTPEQVAGMDKMRDAIVAAIEGGRGVVPSLGVGIVLCEQVAAYVLAFGESNGWQDYAMMCGIIDAIATSQGKQMMPFLAQITQHTIETRALAGDPEAMRLYERGKALRDGADRRPPGRAHRPIFAHPRHRRPR